jgi:hypothetical protein
MPRHQIVYKSETLSINLRAFRFYTFFISLDGDAEQAIPTHIIPLSLFYGYREALAY